MAFDFKKEFKEFYLPRKEPSLVTVPKMNFVAVRGKGNPNEADGEYQNAMGLLYGIEFTIKMSKMAVKKNPEAWQIPGFEDFVVPPLEGLWWQEGIDGVDYSRKNDFCWISMIRLPDFVDESIFQWAIKEASSKKKMDFSKAEFFTYDEGLCVQCLHVGSYDSEPETIKLMEDFSKDQNLENDFSSSRLHHEIYLSDPRKTSVEKLKTVIRHPVKKM